jgi:hypothetical protein
LLSCRQRASINLLSTATKLYIGKRELEIKEKEGTGGSNSYKLFCLKVTRTL